jgi:GT2 family glycosyltransferase
MIEIISATRYDDSSFEHSPLGISLRRLSYDTRLVRQIAFSNTEGLPDVYNRRIAADAPDDILVFIHDDVWLDDIFLADRVVDGLERFQVIGVAGNMRAEGAHVGWAFKSPELDTDEPFLSGTVAVGSVPFGEIHHFGKCPQACELMDGVLLAARRSVLREHDVQFDSRFGFHFYDLDFCRTARLRRLSLGTWPIALTHASAGSFGSDDWKAALQVYKNKWS